MLAPHETSALVNQVRAGDRSAVGALYEAHFERVKKHVAYYVGWHDAPDLAHDVFVKAIEHLPKTRDDTDFLNWVLKVASRVCLDHLRKSSTRREGPSGLASDDPEDGRLSYHLVNDGHRDPDPGPEEGLLSWERAQLVEELLAGLRPEEATALRMQAEGYEHRDIARHLVTPPTALKSRLFRTRANLASQIATNPERYGPLDADRAARALASKPSAYHPKRDRQSASPLHEGAASE